MGRGGGEQKGKTNQRGKEKLNLLGGNPSTEGRPPPQGKDRGERACCEKWAKSIKNEKKQEKPGAAWLL